MAELNVSSTPPIASTPPVTQYDSPYEKEEAEHAEEVAKTVAEREEKAAEARAEEIEVIEAQAAAEEGRATPEQQTLLMQRGDTAYGTTVTTASGNQVVLSPVQVKQINTATGADKFNILAQYNLIDVPAGSKLVDFDKSTGEAIYTDPNKETKSVFIAPQSLGYVPEGASSDTVGIRQVGTVTQDVLSQFPGAKVGDKYAVTEKGQTLLVGKDTRTDDRLLASEANQFSTALSQARKEISTFEQTLANAPDGLRDAYRTGGIAGYNQELQDNYVKLNDGSWVSKSDDARLREQIKDTPELLDAYEKGGISRYNRELINYQENIMPSVSAQVDMLTRQRQYDEAISKLEPYKTVNEKGDIAYNVNKFIVDNPSGESIKALSALNFGRDTISAARDYVGNTDAVIQKLGEDPNKYSLSGLMVQSEALGLLTKDRPGVVTYKRTLEIIDPSAFIDSLTDSEKKSLIGAIANDPNNKNAFASLMEFYNFRYGKLPIADQVILPFVPNIGMPAVALQAVGTTVAKATTGQHITPMEIATDIAATALAVLMHTAPKITGTTKAPVKVFGISGKAIVKSVEAGAVGIFGANIAANWQDMSTTDKVINSTMMAIPAIGMARDIGRLATKGAAPDPVRVAKEQQKVLEQITQTNKDFINRELIKDPKLAIEAEKAYNLMAEKVGDYSSLSLELKQVRKAIGDIGVAKSKGELDLLTKLKARADSLDSEVFISRNAAEKAINEYINVVGNGIKVDDPIVFEELNNLSKDALNDLDNITSQIVSPRTAKDIAADVADMSGQISRVEGLLKEANLTVDQMKAYTSLIRELSGELAGLNREARLRYLETGEVAKLTKGGDYVTEVKSLQQRLIDANKRLEDYKNSSLDYQTYRKGEIISTAEKISAERDIFEAVQKVTEPLVGRESYGDVLDRLNDNLSELINLAKSDKVLQGKIIDAGSEFYQSVRQGDARAIQASIRKLELAAGESSRPLQLKMGEQVKLLSYTIEDIIRGIKRQPIVETKASTQKSGAGIDIEAVYNERIRQEAQRIIDMRWEKLTERLPDAIKNRAPEEIKAYLQERLGTDYFDARYEGLYKNLDDFLDVDRAIAEIRARVEKQKAIQEMERDINISETEKTLTDKFRKEVNDPGLKKMLDDRAETMKRQLEEKKSKLDIAVKEKIAIPQVKIDLTRTTESPVEKEQALVPSEKSISEVVKESKSRKSAEERVKKAVEELSRIREGEKSSAFPGLKPKTTITTRSGREIKTTTERIGAMTPEQAQRLYGEKFKITVAYSPYRINADGTTTMLESITHTSTWLSPEQAIQQAQQLASQTATEIQTSAATALQQATQLQPALSVQPALATEVATATELLPITEIIAPPVVITPTIISPPPKPPPLKPVIGLARLQTNSPTSQPVEMGSIAWVQGSLKGIRGIPNARWWYIPPPYDKEPIPLSAPPMGAKVTGSLDPQETIQIIGTSRAAVPNRVNTKIGWAKISVVNGREIEFDKGDTENVAVQSQALVELPDIGEMPPVGIRRPDFAKSPPERRRIIKKRKWLDDLTSLKGFRP